MIGHIGIRAGQRTKQRRLARVGVADQSERRHGDFGAHLPPGLALLFDLLQPPGEHPDALRDEPAIGFQLRLARTAHADAALLALEVRPPAYQTAADVLQLRKLDFQLALEAARTLREDVEDERVAVEHPAANVRLEIALLARRERVIDEDDVRLVDFRHRAQLIRLAAADKEPRIGSLAAARDRRNRPGAGRFGELLELLQILRIDLRPQSQAHEHGTLTGAWALEHSGLPGRRDFHGLRPIPCPASRRAATAAGHRVRRPGAYIGHSAGVSGAAPPSSVAKRTLRAGTTVEIACLYTIWLTLFLNSTTNWSNESI